MSFEDFPQMFSYHFFCLNKSSQPLDAETKKEMEKRKNAWCCISPRFFALKKAFWCLWQRASRRYLHQNGFISILKEHYNSYALMHKHSNLGEMLHRALFSLTFIFLFPHLTVDLINLETWNYMKRSGGTSSTHIFAIVIFRIDLRASTRIFGFIFLWSLAGSLS